MSMMYLKLNFKYYFFHLMDQILDNLEKSKPKNQMNHFE